MSSSRSGGGLQGLLYAAEKHEVLGLPGNASQFRAHAVRQTESPASGSNTTALPSRKRPRARADSQGTESITAGTSISTPGPPTATDEITWLACYSSARSFSSLRQPPPLLCPAVIAPLSLMKYSKACEVDVLQLASCLTLLHVLTALIRGSRSNRTTADASGVFLSVVSYNIVHSVNFLLTKRGRSNRCLDSTSSSRFREQSCDAVL